jgi:hypothetical protein
MVSKLLANEASVDAKKKGCVDEGDWLCMRNSTKREWQIWCGIQLELFGVREKSPGEVPDGAFLRTLFPYT